MQKKLLLCLVALVAVVSAISDHQLWTEYQHSMNKFIGEQAQTQFSPDALRKLVNHVCTEPIEAIWNEAPLEVF